MTDLNSTNVSEKIQKLLNLAANNENSNQANSAFCKALEMSRVHNVSIKTIAKKTDYKKAVQAKIDLVTEIESRKRNVFGHNVNAISGRIDTVLMTKKLSLKDIAKQAKTTVRRVREHIRQDLRSGMRSKDQILCEVHEVKGRYFITYNNDAIDHILTV